METTTHQPGRVKAFAVRRPFLFAVLCFFVNMALLIGSSGLTLPNQQKTPNVAVNIQQVVVPVIIFVLSVATLAWFSTLLCALSRQQFLSPTRDTDVFTNHLGLLPGFRLCGVQITHTNHLAVDHPCTASVILPLQ